MVDNFDGIIDNNKKGVIVIGSPRSGSHMTCDILYNMSKNKSKTYLGEIFIDQEKYNETLSNILDNNKFIFCSIVQFWAKTILAVDPYILKDFNLINIRRRDKISQYISWCVFRTQLHSSKVRHSPEWKDIETLLPWKSTCEDIDRFLTEQHLDFAFNFNAVVYYEDLINYNLTTRFTKNIYPISKEDIVTNFPLVESKLKNYNYDGR
jgi:hypothetical protein